MISFARTADGIAVGSVTGSATSRDQVRTLSRGGRRRARRAARGGRRLTWCPVTSRPTGGVPEATSITVYDVFAPALGEAFAKAEAEGRILYGFVDHEVTTTYLGSSTGLGARHVQPTGHYGCTGKTTDLRPERWVGGATRDFADVDAAAMDAMLAQRLAWATAGSTCRRVATTRPAPTAVADLIDLRLLGRAARGIAHEASRSTASEAAVRGSARSVRERAGVHLLRPVVRGDSTRAPFAVASCRTMPRASSTTGAVARTDWNPRTGELVALIQTRHRRA